MRINKTLIFTKDSGLKICSTDMGNRPTLKMAKISRDSSCMEANLDKEFSISMMGKSMKVTFTMDTVMEWDSSL